MLRGLEGIDELASLVLTMGHRGHAVLDCSVVAHPDPASPEVDAVRVHQQVEDSLRAHGAFVGDAPAHQDLVVPQADLSTPHVAALGLVDAPRGRLQFVGGVALHAYADLRRSRC